MPKKTYESSEKNKCLIFLMLLFFDCFFVCLFVVFFYKGEGWEGVSQETLLPYR